MSAIWLGLNNLGVDESIIRCIHDFFLGVILMNLCRGTQRMASHWPRTIFFSLLLFTICTVHYHRDAGIGLMFPYLFAALIWLFHTAPENNPLEKALSRPWLAYLGTISLGTYLIHGAVWFVIQNLARAIGISGDFLFHDAAPQSALESELVVTGLIGLGLAMTLWLAHLSWTRLERPANGLRRHDPFARWVERSDQRALAQDTIRPAE